MKSIIRILLISFVILGTLFPQSLTGNFNMDYVTVEYTWVVRDMESTLDFETGGYDLTASWPSSASPIFSYTLKSFSVGDTAAVVLVPLINQLALDYFPYGPVALNVDFNDDGNFIINEGSTYPTTATVNCSTSSTVPPVTENGTWTNGGYTPLIDQFTNTMTTGWGITYSEVFAWFNAPDMVNDVYGVNYGWTSDGLPTPLVNWGMLTATYNEDFSVIQKFDLYWEALDGIETDLGIVDPTDDYYLEEEEGMLNGIMGIPVVPSDTVTIGVLAAIAAQLGITVHVPAGEAVALGAPGIDLDGDGEPDGIVDANQGYLFDPAGSDETPFSGDEALQFTGYYFTYNFMLAYGAFSEGFGIAYATNPADIQGAFTAGATAACSQFVDPTTAAAVGAGVGQTMYDDFLALVTAGVDPETALLQVAATGPTQSLGGLASIGVSANDSDHDFNGADGRLILEVDNLCLPRISTQRVAARFQNTANFGVSTLNISAGWNMIGLPRMAGGYPYNMLLPDANAGTLYSFDGTYRQEDTPVPGTGYWLRFDAAGNPPIEGYGLLSQTINLSEGWNMISGISESIALSAVDDPGNIIIGGSLYGFNGTYTPATAIDPGQGYWVRASADGAITIASGTLAKEIRPVDRLANASSITLTNSEGYKTSLYFGVSIPENEKLSYSLPPLPPQGAFDARFAGDWKYAEESGEIAVMNNTESLTLSYDVVNDERWILISASGKEYNLEGNGELELNAQVNSFTLRKVDAGYTPGVFSLSQNFPNPFNPSTQISFDLPDNQTTEITVWTLTGQKVTTLFAGELDAGQHNFTFNGRDLDGNMLASGMYLYRVEAGPYNSTKKMLLLK